MSEAAIYRSHGIGLAMATVQVLKWNSSELALSSWPHTLFAQACCRDAHVYFACFPDSSLPLISGPTRRDQMPGEPG